LICRRSLKRFLKHCQARNVTGRSKPGVEVFPLIAFDRIHRNSLSYARTAYDANSFLSPIFDPNSTTLSRTFRLPICRKFQGWHLPQFFAVGWTCPEALELHKFFKFVAKYRSAISSAHCCANFSPIQNLRHSIASIRHAAVHRLAQDRNSLLQMNHAAIELCVCIGESPGAENLCRLFRFLWRTLPKSSMVHMQTPQTPPARASLPESVPP
jgi:hypothetical protein